jgi:Tol biopolymer transport system component
MPWEREIPLSELSFFSPDFSRAVFHHGEKDSGLYDIENDTILATFGPTDRFLAWLPDTSGFVMEVPSDAEGGSSASSQLDILDRDGKYLETISSSGSFGYAVLSPDGHQLAFTTDLRLFVADLLEKQVRDYCLDELDIHLWFTNVVRWSPDGNVLAFNYDGYPVLLNTDTLEMEILQYRTGHILGWFSPYPVYS